MKRSLIPGAVLAFVLPHVLLIVHRELSAANALLEGARAHGKAVALLLVGALLLFRKAAELYDPEARDILAQVYGTIAEAELRLNHPVACHAAITHGARIAVSTDAHGVAELGFMRWGIGQARRGSGQAQRARGDEGGRHGVMLPCARVEAEFRAAALRPIFILP